MREPRGQHAGFACSRASENQKRAVGDLYRLALLRVQPVQISVASAGAPGARAAAISEMESLRFAVIPQLIAGFGGAGRGGDFIVAPKSLIRMGRNKVSMVFLTAMMFQMRILVGRSWHRLQPVDLASVGAGLPFVDRSQIVSDIPGGAFL